VGTLEAFYTKATEFMHELVPGASSIAVLANPANPIDLLRTTEINNATNARIAVDCPESKESGGNRTGLCNRCLKSDPAAFW
jgi:hypothetical protein